MEIEFKINDYEHRKAMVIALAHSGYKVWIETKPIKDYSFGFVTNKDYYVCADIPEEERSKVPNDFDKESV